MKQAALPRSTRGAGSGGVMASWHSRQNAAKQNQDDDGGTDPDDDGGGKLRWLVAARHGTSQGEP
jgi:hypothetical protein